MASFGGSRRPWRILLWAAISLVATLVVGAAPAYAASSSGDLLEGLRPIGVNAVRRPERLNDGVAAHNGSFWKTELTTQLESTRSFVVYDLGASRPITAAWLQADNNDTYEIDVSNDDQHFTIAWRALPVTGSGLQPRFSAALHARGRYVRIRAYGGDGAYALSEVQLFSQKPPVFPPQVTVKSAAPLEQNVRTKTLLFGLALIIGLWFAYRGAPWWWTILALLWPAIQGFELLQAIHNAWPVESRGVSLVRGVIAVVAAAAIVRESFAIPRHLPNKRVVLGVLGLCGVASFLAFYNLGQPQFWDSHAQKWTFVHYLDLRQYYATAKYFDEIGYTGLYQADMAAYFDDHPNLSPDSLAKMPMRDLRTLQMSTVGAQRDEIANVRYHFTPTRWAAYRHDARYFRNVMGQSTYFDTMHDMGGNATPVWMSTAHLLFNVVHPTNHGFLLTALLDPLLLTLTFIAIWRAFGIRTMLLCLVIFGANDFIMYGTNWAGATLRHDWLAYIGLGACALKKEKWVLGGVLFAAATMIRAFPGLTLFGVTVVGAWWVFDYRQQHGKFPSLRVIRTEQKPVVHTLFGGALGMAALFIYSIIVLPIAAWPECLRKVGELSADPHANHISLRSLIAGWSFNQGAVLHARMPLFLIAAGAYVVMVLIACRHKRLEQAALIAMVLLPVLLYPANYYIHFIFLLPMIVMERRAAASDAPESGTVRPRALSARDATFGLILLGLCAAQYFTVLVTERGLHFYLANALLFVTITALLGLLVYEVVAQEGWLALPAPLGADGAAVLASSEPGIAASSAPNGANGDHDEPPPSSRKPAEPGPDEPPARADDADATIPSE